MYEWALPVTGSSGIPIHGEKWRLKQSYGACVAAAHHPRHHLPSSVDYFM